MSPQEKLWKNIREWIHRKISDSNILDQAALEVAAKSYLRNGLSGKPDCQDDMDEIIYYPDLYKDVSFLIYSRRDNRETIAEEIENSGNDSLTNDQKFYSWALRRTFLDWDAEEISKLKNDIISIYLGERNSLEFRSHSVAYRFPLEGFFFTSASKSPVTKAVLNTLGSINSRQAVRRIARYLKSKHPDQAGFVLNSQEFSCAYNRALTNNTFSI